jgi:hypothetical protein
LCGNDTSNWDQKVPVAQLCANYKIRNRTASSPFSLMFARQLNKPQDYTSPKIRDSVPKKLISEEDLIKRAELLSSVVFPAINERTQRLVEEQSRRFNQKHYLIDIPINSPVMVKLPNRTTKLAPLYEGPYIVVRKTRGGSYVLKDETNELLHREYVPSELKMVSIDETFLEEEFFEVAEIRDHRDTFNGREYLVKWVGYGERENSWLQASAFSSPTPIKKYWDKMRELKKLEQERKAKLVVERSDKRIAAKQAISSVGDRRTVGNKSKRSSSTFKNQFKELNPPAKRRSLRHRKKL